MSEHCRMSGTRRASSPQIVSVTSLSSPRIFLPSPAGRCCARTESLCFYHFSSCPGWAQHPAQGMEPANDRGLIMRAVRNCDWEMPNAPQVNARNSSFWALSLSLRKAGLTGVPTRQTISILWRGCRQLQGGCYWKTTGRARHEASGVPRLQGLGHDRLPSFSLLLEPKFPPSTI